MLSNALRDFFGTASLAGNEAPGRALAASTACIVVDAQRVFCDPQAIPDWYDPDWHIRDCHYQRSQAVEKISTLKTQLKNWGARVYVVCKQLRSYGELADGIVLEQDDISIQKPGVGSFRTGFSLWLKGPSELERSLHENHVERVLVSGFYTDVCVTAAVLGALRRKFKACVVADCTEAGGASLAAMPAKKEKALGRMEAHGACVTNLAEISAALH